MNKQTLRELWDLAEFTGESVDIGDRVFCDFCGDDYSESDARGGILFETKAACPECAPRIEATAAHHNELRFIHARARSDQLFREFVLALRGGDNTIRVRKGGC